MRQLIPNFILKQKNNSGEILGTILFLDLIGFTNLTETLVKNKKDGIEELTSALNRVFQPIVTEIYRLDGFIITFAGDAITAHFSDDLAALKVAQIINNSYTNNKIKTRYGVFKLKIRVGLAYGKTNWEIFSETTKQYLFYGKTIFNAIQAQNIAINNRVVCHKSLVEKCNDKTFFTQFKDDFYNLETLFPKENKIANIIIRESGFFPEINDEIVPEFREVLPIFVKIKETQNIREISETICKISQKYDAYLNKFDMTENGCYALLIFGAPISYEDNIIRSLNLSLDLIKLADIDKIGISLGVAYSGFIGGIEREEYTIIGDVTNLAARFMSFAKSKEIIVSKQIYEIAKNSYNFKFYGDLKLKGVAGKTSSFQLIKKETSINSIDFIGRTNEINIINNWIKSNEKTLSLIGESGIGKRTLIEHCKQERTEYTWFNFTNNQITNDGFSTIIDFLKNYFEVAVNNSYKDLETRILSRINFLRNNIEITKNDEYLVMDLIRNVSIIVGYLGYQKEDSLFSILLASQRYNAFKETLKNLIILENRFNKVIITIDDIQWIDLESLKFFSGLENHNIKIIQAIRLNYDGSIPNTKLEAKTKIILEKFSQNEILAMLQNSFSQANEIDKNLIELIEQKSTGHPLFIDHLIKSLNEQNLLKLDSGSLNFVADSLIEIPSTIQTLIISRIDQFPPRLKEFLKKASIIGHEFFINFLRKLTNITINNEEITKLTLDNIWKNMQENLYSFKSSLVKETIYGMQMRSTLRELHLLVAKSYEELYQDKISEYYGEIAYHYEIAENFAKCREFLFLAGKHAFDNYLNNDTKKYFQKYILLNKSQDSQLAEIYNMLGIVEETLGDWDQANQYYQKSIEIGENLNDKEIIGRGLVSLSNVYNSQSKEKEALEVNERAIKLLTEIDAKILLRRAIAESAGLLAKKGKYKEALTKYYEALEIAKRTNKDSEVAHIESGISTTYAYLGDIENAIIHGEKAVELSEKSKFISSKAGFIGNLGLIYRFAGKIDKATECMYQSLEIKEKIGDKQSIGIITGNLALIHKDNGEIEKAIIAFEKKLEISQYMNDNEGSSVALINLASIYQIKGKYQLALKTILQAQHFCEICKNSRNSHACYTSLGNIYYEIGDLENSLKYYNLAVQIAKVMENPKVLATSYNHVAIILFETKEYSNALHYVNLSNEAFLLNDTNKILLQILIETKDFKKVEELESKLENRDFYEQLLIFKYKFFSKKITAKDFAEQLLNLLGNEADETKKIEIYYEIAINCNDDLYKQKVINYYENLAKDFYVKTKRLNLLNS